MGNGTPPVGLDEATYFINVAVIAGALIGLTFIALQLFMVDMLSRFEASAFPVFRSRENHKLRFRPIRRDTPAALTKANGGNCLDGDPLVCVYGILHRRVMEPIPIAACHRPDSGVE